jgi:hypothetical protein
MMPCQWLSAAAAAAAAAVSNKHVQHHKNLAVRGAAGMAMMASRRRFALATQACNAQKKLTCWPAPNSGSMIRQHTGTLNQRTCTLTRTHSRASTALNCCTVAAIYLVGKAWRMTHCSNKTLNGRYTTQLIQSCCCQQPVDSTCCRHLTAGTQQGLSRQAGPAAGALSSTSCTV